jgi:hypothetical protein
MVCQYKQCARISRRVAVKLNHWLAPVVALYFDIQLDVGVPISHGINGKGYEHGFLVLILFPAVLLFSLLSPKR